MSVDSFVHVVGVVLRRTAYTPRPMGLADRDYSRVKSDAHRAGNKGPRGRMFGGLLGRMRSNSPRGGFSATFIVVVVCTSVFFLDLVLPNRFVQSSPWIAAPAQRDPVQSISRRIAQIDEFAKALVRPATQPPSPRCSKSDPPCKFCLSSVSSCSAKPMRLGTRDALAATSFLASSRHPTDAS